MYDDYRQRRLQSLQAECHDHTGNVDVAAHHGKIVQLGEQKGLRIWLFFLHGTFSCSVTHQHAQHFPRSDASLMDYLDPGKRPLRQLLDQRCGRSAINQ